MGDLGTIGPSLDSSTSAYRQACYLGPSYEKLAFGVEPYCWSSWDDLNLNLAVCLQILCSLICDSGVLLGVLIGVECLLPSYAAYCILNLTVRKSYCVGHFLGGALKQMNTFFPLNKRSVFTGNYSSPLYPKARSRTCCHSPSHAFSTIV